mgnify:CR=1 FL=1
MTKKVLPNKEASQPFTSRDTLAQYMLHAMEERAKESKSAEPNAKFVAAIHLYLKEVERGDKITV